MVSVIITSWKEPNTIAKAIRCVADKAYSGVKEEIQVIQVSPDAETLKAGREEAKRLKLANYLQVKDPQKGKPYALNLALDKVKGDIIVLTDGDVYFGENALKLMLKPFEDPKIGGVSGFPTPQNERKGFLGYLSHMLTDVADDKRRTIFTDDRGSYLVNEGKAFLLSGYIRANRNIGEKYNVEYIDDAYMTSVIHKKGYKLAYVPEAKAYVKFPMNMRDYFIQRRRNIAGNRKMHLSGIAKDLMDERALTKELMYMTYPIRYAKTPIEMFWSLLWYPLRFFTWVYTWPTIRKEIKESNQANWERIESTK